MNQYIVQILEYAFNYSFDLYIQHVYSYKKGRCGVICTLDSENAHKYKSEKTALKCAQIYNGKVKMI